MVTREMEQAITEGIMEAMDKAVGVSIENIIMELPKGKNSSIADKIYHARIGDDTIFIFTETPIWGYLSDGTGIYSEKHRGQGLGGRIVPIHGAKVLHFKNAELAAALGFPNEDVFLASVAGIRGRFFWERHFETSRFADVFSQVQG